MLRLVLLVLYLIASSSSSLHTKQDSGAVLNPFTPAAPSPNYGAGYDPNG